MIVSFTKMHGCGNDFIVADNRSIKKPLDWWITHTPFLCDRKKGIGADGLLLMEASEVADYTMIYRNADGSDAGMCGNGGRCIAAYATTCGFGASHTFEVHKNVYKATVSRFSETEALVDLAFPMQVKPEMRAAGFEQYAFAYTGTEHIVVPATENRLAQTDWLRKRGSDLRYNAALSKNGANVNFFAKKDGRIHLQTYERGVENLTLACGTGALATVIADHYLSGNTTINIQQAVDVAGGTLSVSAIFEPETRVYHDLVLSGPAVAVFSGHLSLD
jgi:diaminopimelate epimerase